ncbi:zona pellucida sperm-binding protein 3-like [Neolamprologus brichardi]|uniref:zona pellucida sperm-binding protein 3-like n=1 Tax=Neolamprologus brichardi TaxID=32507 RepID=UPI001643E569|nr:zona pellucida sperm-binding protein 3-like [Neolamprologus brichardi]
MGCRQLVAFSFVLAWVRLSDARFHSLNVPTHLGIKAQRPAEADAPGEPDRVHSSQPAQQAATLNQQALEPLSWRFPEDPVDRVNKPFKFELKQPEAAYRVAVRCGESKIFVEVSRDLLGLGKLIKPEEISLGGCSATEADDSSHVLVFESELHSCGSELVLTENAFIYAFALVYNPEVFGRSGITRSQSAVIRLECHYQRQHGASSDPEHPAWMSSEATRQAQTQQHFSLKLMTDDWKSERTSTRYALVDVIHMEAAVLVRTRTPLRVLVDRCVATTKSDFASGRREALINDGCLGGQHTISRFMPRSQPDKLRLQVAVHSLGLQGMIYISCLLKAISASAPVTIENKACSFYEGYENVFEDLSFIDSFKRTFMTLTLPTVCGWL